jgi:hypothetical protein
MDIVYFDARRDDGRFTQDLLAYRPKLHSSGIIAEHDVLYARDKPDKAERLFSLHGWKLQHDSVPSRTKVFDVYGMSLSASCLVYRRSSSLAVFISFGMFATNYQD